MPLHANQAKGPNTRHIAPAPSAAARPVSGMANLAVSTASAPSATVPKNHAT